MEDLAWQNGSRIYAVICNIGPEASTSADRRLFASFLPAVSQLAYDRLVETCGLLSEEVQQVAEAPQFVIRCAGTTHTTFIHTSQHGCMCMQTTM